MSAYDVDKAKVDEVAAKKPRVWGIVGLGIIRGLFTGFLALNNLQEIQRLSNDPNFIIYDYAEPFQYIALGLAAFSILAAIFLATYKRWGLYLGIVAFGGDILFGILALVVSGGAGGSFPFLAFIIDAIVVRYIYKYMTSHPETTFFT